ncbi:MAG: PilZ domain-containing protein [Nitrospiraceae bacterium]
MERRKHVRVATASFSPVTVSFSGEVQGTGTLYDVSPGGCKIDSRVTPPLGASLTLRLSLFDQTQPVVIDDGIVGWTIKNKYFGVKFLKLKPREQEALNRYLAALFK